jgi:hypothetical protein
MRRLRVLATLVLLSSATYAQKSKNENPLPSFGKIEKADLEMKECSFDDKAAAMVLVDDAQLDYIYNAGMEMKRRVRIKILNDKGLEWANIHLPFRSYRNEEDISSLEAQTYNLDASGNIVATKLDKKLVYEKKLNKRYTEKVFTLPDVKVGSIIEYKFKHTGVGLIDWYFQSSIPVKHSRFTLDFPEEIEVRVVPYCSHDVEKTNGSSARRQSQTYSMTNVPAFQQEPFLINEDFYRDRLVTKVVAYESEGRRVNRTANWLQVIRFLMEDEDFGLQIKKEIPRTTDLDDKLKGLTNDYERMKTVYKYVQSSMQWNDYVGIWASDGVKSAWKDKKGTVGEINLILVNLLKSAGLSAYPVLVSTHDNGLVNTADAGTFDYPGFYQFNKAMAYVEIGDRKYVLDATEKDVPAHLVPPDVLMTEGLVISKIETYDWGWKSLWDNSLQSKSIILSNGSIDADGKMTGETTIHSYDYARLSRLPYARKGKDKYIEQFITASNPSLVVDDVKFENLDSDSLPLKQTVSFSQPLATSGDYSYFSANVLSGLEKNPFIADNRSADIFFGTNQSYLLIGNFRLPDGFEFDALPKNIKMIMPDTSIVMSRVSQISGNILMTKIQLDFTKPIYAAADYAEFQEFYKQLFDFMNEQYVVRKKK